MTRRWTLNGAVATAGAGTMNARRDEYEAVRKAGAVSLRALVHTSSPPSRRIADERELRDAEQRDDGQVPPLTS